jgi:hypothetical protein
MIRDLRKYARQTNFRLAVVGLVLLFGLGTLLIYWFYGPSAAIGGLLCMGVGLVPIALILVFFAVADWIVKRANRD